MAAELAEVMRALEELRLQHPKKGKTKKKDDAALTDTDQSGSDADRSDRERDRDRDKRFPTWDASSKRRKIGSDRVGGDRCGQ